MSRGMMFLENPLDEIPWAKEWPMVSSVFAIMLARNPLLMFAAAIAGTYYLISGLAWRHLFFARAWVADQGMRTPAAVVTVLLLSFSLAYLACFFYVKSLLPVFDRPTVADEDEKKLVLKFRTAEIAWRNCKQWLEFGIILLVLAMLGFALTL